MNQFTGRTPNQALFEIIALLRLSSINEVLLEVLPKILAITHLETFAKIYSHRIFKRAS